VVSGTLSFECSKFYGTFRKGKETKWSLIVTE
jgi:hypothetical protein